jgi:hypothetical protein
MYAIHVAETSPCEQIFEYVIPAGASVRAACIQVFLDETILDSACLVCFFLSTGLLEGWSLRKVREC